MNAYKRVLKRRLLIVVATLGLASFGVNVQDWTKGMIPDFVVYGQSGTAAETGGSDNRSANHVFAQVVDGRFSDGTNYRSTLVIQSDASNAVNCTASLVGLTIPGFGDGQNLSISLAAGAAAVVDTAGTQTIRTGYMTLICSSAVTAQLLYSLNSSSGAVLSEATVFSSPPVTVAQLIADQRDGAQLGIAVANNSNAGKNLQIVASDLSGGEVNRATATVGAKSQVAKFLSDFLTVPSNFLGTVRISEVGGAGGDIYAIGIRYNGVAFTTIPVTSRTTGGGGAQAAPTIRSFTPASGAAGTSVTISGSDFTGASAVRFNGMAASFTVNSSSSITATVPSGAASGPITVITPGGTATSSSSFTITSSCAFSLSPSSASFSATGGTGSVAVSVASGCAWRAASSELWITITAGTSGSGNGTVTYSVAPNAGASSRVGTLTIGEVTFTVRQESATCTYSISPTSRSHNAGTESGTVAVTTSSACNWTAASNVSWVTISSEASGAGNGTVSYSVAANTEANSRTGTLTIAGQTFTITQTSSPPPTLVSVSPNTGERGTIVNVTLVGTNFAAGMTVSAGSDITVSDVSVSNSSATTATFTISAAAAAGPRNVTVTTSRGTSGSQVFTVTVPLSLSSLTLSSSSVNGGQPSVGTVAINSSAPLGGTTVNLSSNNPAVTVPGSVVIPAGSTSATFIAATTVVSASVTATVTARLGASSVQATLTVTASAPTVSFSSLTFNPPSVPGGQSSAGTLTISGPAPSGGTTVNLSSNNPAVTVPGSVVIPASSTSATFTVTTTAVSAPVTATVTASTGGSSIQATLTITAASTSISFSGLSFNSPSVVGGQSSVGTVNITTAAPTGGVTVNLSSNQASVTVPASIVIPVGATSTTFSVTTTSVSTNVTATITAGNGGSSIQASLTVTPPATSNISVSSLTFNPSSIAGGQASVGTVTIGSPAPSGGTTVNLSATFQVCATICTDSGSHASFSIPANVLVPAGSTTGTFTVATTGVSGPVTATITASIGTSSVAKALRVVPLITVTSITFSASAVTAGQDFEGTVTISSPAPLGGAQVEITGAGGLNLGGFGSKTRIDIGSNATTGKFVVLTNAVSAPGPATVTATVSGINLVGGPPAQATVTMITVTNLRFDPVTLSPKQSTTATITISNPAPSGGSKVTLQYREPLANLDTFLNLLVPAGSTTTTFTYTAGDLKSPAYDMTFTAFTGAAQAQATLAVR